MKRFTILIGCVVAACLMAQTGSRSGGIAPDNIDKTCKPCEDFWRFANGTWLDKNPIPDDSTAWGPGQIMTKANRERIQTILTAASTDTTAPAGSSRRKLGDFYASCMDTATIDARGIEPLKPELDRIEAIQDRPALAAALARYQRMARPSGNSNGVVVGLFNLVSSIDRKDPKRVLVHLVERESAGRTPSSVFSLPDRDYYLNKDAKSEGIRREFLAHVAKMLTLAGADSTAADGQAAKVLAFETSLAESTMTIAQRRDPEATYYPMGRKGLEELAPAFDWRATLREAGVPENATVVVTEPEMLKKASQLVAQTPLEDWRTWLRWRNIRLAAPYLAKPFSDEEFHFAGAVLSGVKQAPPRVETCAGYLDRDFSDPLGEAYVAKYFPPESKRRMEDLVANVKAAMRDELQGSEWMADATKRAAIAKLDAVKVQVGYPNRWRDYSAIPIGRKTFYENVRASWEFSRAYDWSQIGKPVQYDDWAMTAPTVNAYSSSISVKVVFPAGYLQPPYFDPNGDDAGNYAGIGTTIGHELGHQFDDGGSKFDAQGEMRNWWTDQDKTRFDSRTACVVDQFNSIDVGGGLHHNGRQVLGEALGDLGGLRVAYRAYRKALAGKPETVIDGYTPDQRFFIAFAQKWGSQSRDETTRLQLATDNHPLSKYRANATLANMPEFHKAFRCSAGDPMVRTGATQCRLW